MNNTTSSLNTSVSDNNVDILPPWNNYNLVLVEVTETGYLSVVAGPRPFKNSFVAEFYREIHDIQGYNGIVGSANLVAVALCIRGHEKFPNNVIAQKLAQSTKHLGGDVLVVVKQTVFESFLENHNEEYTLSADTSSEEQTEVD